LIGAQLSAVGVGTRARSGIDGGAIRDQGMSVSGSSVISQGGIQDVRELDTWVGYEISGTEGKSLYSRVAIDTEEIVVVCKKSTSIQYLRASDAGRIS
jgi:hypothetical protein